MLQTMKTLKQKQINRKQGEHVCGMLNHFKIAV